MDAATKKSINFIERSTLDIVVPVESNAISEEFLRISSKTIVDSDSGPFSTVVQRTLLFFGSFD